MYHMNVIAPFIGKQYTQYLGSILTCIILDSMLCADPTHTVTTQWPQALQVGWLAMWYL